LKFLNITVVAFVSASISDYGLWGALLYFAALRRIKYTYEITVRPLRTCLWLTLMTLLVNFVPLEDKVTF